MKRILLAGLFHETHCFVDETTRLDDFRISRGHAILDFRGNGSMIDGFLEVADKHGWKVLPVCAYSATPSGIVDDEVVEAFWQDLAPAAAAGGFDAVFLSLHGAMVSKSLQDVEGTLLARLRALPGLNRIPVFGAFDLHANMSDRMAACADGLVCYRENPHADARETAVRAAELLARALGARERPRTAVRRSPVIWPPTGTGTADAPMIELEALARRIENSSPGVWAVNVVAGFSFADCRDAGVAFSIVADSKWSGCEAALNRLCELAWELRHEGLPKEIDPCEALGKIAASSPSGPSLLVEPSDNIGGGAPGDGTGILRALLDTKQENAAVVINDPESVAEFSKLDPGERLVLPIGGKASPPGAGPVNLDAELVSKSDGRFTLEDAHSHLIASAGKHVSMGPCAVVRHGGVTLLLTSKKTPPFDLGQWRSQGLEPCDFKVIGIKAAVAHRRAYDPISAASYTVSTPGHCASDPRLLPFRNLRRPIFPLDLD